MAHDSERTTYEVFLSFRGPDTRQGFTDVLYHALNDARIRVFRDDEEIRKGEYIEGEILRVITESKIFMPIFSRGYASSKWCLMELAEMFKSLEEAPAGGSRKILPIFYDVTVDDVKLTTDLYLKALEEHKKRFGEERVKPWEEALKEVGKIKGWEVKDTGHGEFVKLLVKEISMKLEAKHKFLRGSLVQRDDQVESLMKLLEVEASEVWFVGIHGMGGIGKTTLAKIVYNKLCNHYEHCCFLVDVRESSKQHKGIEHLQKQLLGNLGRPLGDIADVSDGIKAIRGILGRKKVLIVLDDVNHMEQIQNLVGESDDCWFGEGSRIIITTRNKDVLGIDFRTFEVVEMKPGEALRLFSMHAFRKESPPNDTLDLSKEVVASTGGLPLALEVIGSLLRGKDREDWDGTIKSLKETPHKDVEKTLMISYEALDHGIQRIFLDIACFFIGHEKTYPLYMWGTPKFNANYGLDELIDKSLVKIVLEKLKGGKKMERLWMHDQLRDLGRNIVHTESDKNGKTYNRIWTYEDASELLQEEEGKENVELIRLSDDCNPAGRRILTREELLGFKSLRYLECHGVDFSGDGSHLLHNLMWLSCTICPSELTVTGLSLKKLVILDLSRNHISEDWRGWGHIEVGNKLKVLDLSYKGLRKTPNFSNYSSLERLILEGCQSLNEIDPSIGKLEGLIFLNVDGCTSLRNFPESIGRLSRLRHLSLRGCMGFEILPSSLADMKSLVELHLSSTMIKALPRGVGRLAKLEILDLRWCERMEELPYSIGDMKSLIMLDLRYSGITALPTTFGMQLKRLKHLRASRCRLHGLVPNSVGNMRSIIWLDLAGTSISKLPDTIGNLQELRVILIDNAEILELPTSIGMLKRLEILCASKCPRLKEIPSTIGGCTSLRFLDFNHCSGVKKLPDSVGDMRSLLLLDLSETGISELPDTTRNLQELRAILIERIGIRELPTSVGMLKRLEVMNLRDCKLLTEIPSEIEGCTKLRLLNIRGTSVKQLPEKLRVPRLMVRGRQPMLVLHNVVEEYEAVPLPLRVSMPEFQANALAQVDMFRADTQPPLLQRPRWTPQVSIEREKSAILEEIMREIEGLEDLRFSRLQVSYW